jgi:hypothetical protein
LHLDGLLALQALIFADLGVFEGQGADLSGRELLPSGVMSVSLTSRQPVQGLPMKPRSPVVRKAMIVA